VPLTIYCSGYGDVAAQVLALSTPGTYFEGGGGGEGGREGRVEPVGFHGVPLTIFCSGYGDVAAQVLALSTPGRLGEEREGGTEGGTQVVCC